MAFEWPRPPRNDDRPWRLFRQTREDESARMSVAIVVKRCQGCPNSRLDWKGAWCITDTGPRGLAPDEENIPDFCRLPLYEGSE